MAQVDVPLRRWTRAEYERLVECGFFQPGDRVELIGGQLPVARTARTCARSASQTTCIAVADLLP